jgi:uncharacterized delta-60 repeat protein
MNRTIASLIVIALTLVLALPYPVRAAPGDLDISFGTDGKVITNFPYNGAVVVDLALQTDGKIIAAGGAGASVGADLAGFALARYNQDGSLDPTFGTGGQVITDFTAGEDVIQSIVLQSDGKIVAAGHSNFTGGSTEDFALARYNTDGSLDSSFGASGKVVTDFNSRSDSVISIALQNDDKIIAAGWTETAGEALNFALARYNTDGNLDSTFGVGGKVSTDFFSSNDYATSVKIYTDGSILGVFVKCWGWRISGGDLVSLLL